MIRGNRNFTTANLAIATVLLCGTSAAFAQDAVPASEVQVVAPPPIVEAAPAPTAPATTTVAPPPVVPTITQVPEVAVEAREPVRQRAEARPATRAATRTAVRAAPSVAPAEPVSAAVTTSEPALVNDATADNASLVTATDEDMAPVAPVGQPAATPIADGTSEDWMIYGGLGAALALAGLGGMIAARRRRTRADNAPFTYGAHTAMAPTAPRPLPVQSSSGISDRFTAPAVAAPVKRPSIHDANLPPVTDPLFSHRPVLAAITDPLFMHETVVPPVTDPMFADKDEYVGPSAAGAAFDKRRDWPSARSDERKPLHEFEPAE